MAGLSGMSWLTPLASTLARQAEKRRHSFAKSLIILWLEGGPSQLETFDPHPNSKISYGSRARKTNVPGVFLGEGFEQLAAQMDSISLIRSVTSREGDHERAIYNMKSGYRPDPTVNHPSIGSIICHQFDESDRGIIEIPRHISIIPGSQPARGGYLGDQYDAFKIYDPRLPVPDVVSPVPPHRQQSRLELLNRLDQGFIDGRLNRRKEQLPDSLKNQNISAALQMMSSEQLSAFDLSQIPEKEKLAFGDSAFGRACLAAIRLIAAGVRCVEITLGGWDTHVNNHELHANLIRTLDPAFASLIRELKQRDLIDSTVVVCGGEFGRTPLMNPLAGRDHWPSGFSMAVAGGNIVGGRVVGKTSSDPAHLSNSKRALDFVEDVQPLENIHATIISSLGIDPKQELETPIGRPLKLSEGRPIENLMQR